MIPLSRPDQPGMRNNWPSQSFAYLTLGLVAKDFQRLLELSGVTDSLRAVASLLQRLWCGGPQTFVVRPKLGFCVFRIYVEPIEKKWYHQGHFKHFGHFSCHFWENWKKKRLITRTWNILLWWNVLICLTFDNISHNIMCGQKATKGKQILRPK